MDVIKLFFDSYEQDLFDLTGTVSWLELFEYFLFCSFIVVALFFIFILPISLLFVLFSVASLW